MFHQKTEDSVLLDNENITSPVVIEYNNEDVVVRRPGWIFRALILAAVALAGLLYYFYDHRFSTSTIGNQNKVTIKAAEKTYFEPGK